MDAILRRGFLIPWIFSALGMYALSFLWHGMFLTDIDELSMPFGLYMLLSGIVYLTISFAITLAIDQCLLHDIIKLKKGFPLVSFLFAGVIGFLLYLIIFILGGVTFSDHGAHHVVVDIIWQIVETGLGGMFVAFGIIYDVRRIQIEIEGGK